MIIVLAWYKTEREYRDRIGARPGPLAVVFATVHDSVSIRAARKAAQQDASVYDFARIYEYVGDEQDFLTDARKRIKEEYNDYCNKSG